MNANPQLTILNLPPEMISHIGTFLSRGNYANLGGSCRQIADTVYPDLFSRLCRDLNIPQPSYEQSPLKTFVKKIPYLRNKNAFIHNNLSIFMKNIQKKPERDDFFDCKKDACHLRDRVGMKPSQNALETALQKMKEAAEHTHLDPATFNFFIPLTLKHLDNAKLRNIYYHALTTLPRDTFEKMLETRSIDYKSDATLQSLIRGRGAEFKNFL
jgi:hypothetical protein